MCEPNNNFSLHADIFFRFFFDKWIPVIRSYHWLSIVIFTFRTVCSIFEFKFKSVIWNRVGLLLSSFVQYAQIFYYVLAASRDFTRMYYFISFFMLSEIFIFYFVMRILFQICISSVRCSNVPCVSSSPYFKAVIIIKIGPERVTDYCICHVWP